jgi:hypothetical protein
MEFPIYTDEELNRPLVEEGKFKFQVKDLLDTNANDGKPMWVLDLWLPNFNAIIVKVWIKFDGSTLSGKLIKSLCVSIGKPWLYEKGKITRDDIINMWGFGEFKMHYKPKQDPNDPNEKQKKYLNLSEFLYDAELIEQVKAANPGLLDEQEEIPF